MRAVVAGAMDAVTAVILGPFACTGIDTVSNNLPP